MTEKRARRYHYNAQEIEAALVAARRVEERRRKSPHPRVASYPGKLDAIGDERDRLGGPRSDPGPGARSH